MSIDLTRVFEYIGGLYVRELRDRILSRRQDIDGNPYTPIKPSTARARAAMLGATVRKSTRQAGAFFNRGITLTGGRKRKSAAPAVPITRLLFTGRFAKNAFKYVASTDRVKVYVSGAMYPVHWTQQPISYADIVRFNNAGSPDVNPNIARSPYPRKAPLIFPNPNRPDQVRAMDAFDKANQFIQSPGIRKMIIDKAAADVFRKVSIEVKI